LDYLPNGIEDGLYVEAKSNEALNANGQLVAYKVEQETNDHDSNDEDEYEVKGLITTISDTEITINGETFVINADTVFDPADVALFVEGALVEGIYDADGALIATKIELEDHHSDTIKTEFSKLVIAVNVTDVNTGTITLAGDIKVLVNNDTIMKDSSSANLPMFNLEGVAVDDYLVVKAIDNGDGTYTALKIEREDAPVI